MISLEENLALPALYIQIFITLLLLSPAAYSLRRTKEKFASRLQQKPNRNTSCWRRWNDTFSLPFFSLCQESRGCYWLSDADKRRKKYYFFLFFVIDSHHGKANERKERFFHESRNRTTDDSNICSLLEHASPTTFKIYNAKINTDVGGCIKTFSYKYRFQTIFPIVKHL